MLSLIYKFVKRLWKKDNKSYKIAKTCCPICFEDKIVGVVLKSCKHGVCKLCMKSYIISNYKDLSKYPLKCCCLHECDTILENDIIQYILNETEFKTYKRFETIHRVPPNERLHCPNNNCDNIMIKNVINSKIYNHWENISNTYLHNGNKSHFYNENSIHKCQSPLCNKSFGIIMNWKYHCNICGKVFCHQCTKWKMTIKELGYHNTEASMCLLCFTEIFNIQCTECNYDICIRCENKWHNVMDGEICGLSNENNKNDLHSKNDRKTTNLINNQGYTKCPTCGIIIEKIDGCNHIHHIPCNTHFCYICGDILFGKYNNYDSGGINHFPNGKYYECRKGKNIKNNNNNNDCIIM